MVCGCINSVIPTDGSVTKIGSDAFLHNRIEHIAIPDGITEIGFRAFLSCSKLKSVTIGKDVTALESEAFRFCDALTSCTFAKKDGWAYYDLMDLIKIKESQLADPAEAAKIVSVNLSRRIFQLED